MPTRVWFFFACKYEEIERKTSPRGGHRGHIDNRGGRASSSSDTHSTNLDREEELAQNPVLSLCFVVQATSLDSIVE